MHVLSFSLPIALLALGPSDLLEMQEYPVRPLWKTFVVSEQLPPGELGRLRKMPRTTVRVILKGNMIRDSWVAALNDLEPDRVDVVVGPGLLRTHVTQLKRIRKLMVTLDLGGARFTQAVARELGALGPVRKTVVLHPGFTKSSLEKYAVLKAWDVQLDAREGGISAEEIAMIAELPGSKRVVVRSSLPAAEYARLRGTKNIALTVEVEKNALNEDLAALLAGLGLPVTLQITDAVDEEKYKALFAAGTIELEVIPADATTIRTRVLDLLRRTDP